MSHPSLQQTTFDWSRFHDCPGCGLPTFDVVAGECRMCPQTDSTRCGQVFAVLLVVGFWALVIGWLL